MAIRILDRINFSRTMCRGVLTTDTACSDKPVLLRVGMINDLDGILATTTTMTSAFTTPAGTPFGVGGICNNPGKDTLTTWSYLNPITEQKVRTSPGGWL